ncbi:hypothetical protein SASPL_109438 [Salvia splendens]|uniref:Myb/SANT-like domain-containing protein n=1 Tax=Salvia splendens TaxID=180675 RepID=A0A8X8YGI6_SALSN|nr:hypothetical protein SASPL_109438 [Salvia splendens]
MLVFERLYRIYSALLLLPLGRFWVLWPLNTMKLARTKEVQRVMLFLIHVIVYYGMYTQKFEIHQLFRAIGSNDFYPNRNSKADRSRRIWSVREEEILMATLKELAANGWKSDNGFRSGYLKDRHAKYMRNKSWPQYEDWKEVFGQDRADGERGIDVSAAAGTIYGQQNEVPVDEPFPPHMTFAELFPDEPIPDGILPDMIADSQSVTEGGVPGSGAGVDVGTVSGAGVRQPHAVGAASGSGSGPEQKLTKKVMKKRRIGYEFDLSNKRAEVFDQLKGLPGLSLKLQFYVSKKLVKEPELLDLFRGHAVWKELARETPEHCECVAISTLRKVYTRLGTQLCSDVETSDDYVPSDTDGGDSSDEEEYVPDPGF